MIKLKTNFGEIVIELDTENTPLTAANFMRYAEEEFFKGTIFHRVMKGFMIQGGGHEPGMGKKETHDSIENEADKGGKNTRGTLAMARTNDPHSATAQFFINLVDNNFLNFKSKTEDGWGYCVFGKVIEGMDVVDAIAKVDTGRVAGHSDVPLEEVIIEDVIIEDVIIDNASDDVSKEEQTQTLDESEEVQTTND